MILACALAVSASAAPAFAEITPSRDADAIAEAIGDQLAPEVLIGGEFTVIPPLPSDNQAKSFHGPPGGDPNPTAIANAPLTGFPFSGGTFTVLSSGNSTFADDQNAAGNTGQGNNGDDGGHGATFRDLVTLRVDLDAPQDANCLSVDFRFLSDEFPEYVGNKFNDAFIAELDVSDFSADSAQNNKISAPHNFAFDGQNNVISVNTTGTTEMSTAEATGTTYDGATPRLRAAVPVTPGMHAVYFSIFDQGDDAFDSAVFLDNLVVFAAPAGACKTGATPDVTPPDTTITAGPAADSTTNDTTPTFEFTSNEAGSTFQCRIDNGEFTSCSAPHTTDALSPGQHTFSVRAIDPAGNVDQSPASRTFTVGSPDNTPPDTTITGGPTGLTNDGTPTFTFTSNEAGSTFDCSIDGRAFATCSSPHTTAVLPDSQHTIEVRARDASGNVDPTPARRTFTVSLTPPPPPPPPPPPGPRCNGVAATIVGTAGKDKIRGTNRRDVIVALGSNDKINGRGGNDLICAGDGDDKVDGGAGDDVIYGQGGRDRLRGGAGNDRVQGGAGKDTVHGQSGNDRLSGGAQRDRCRGGSGQNVLLSCES